MQGKGNDPPLHQPFCAFLYAGQGSLTEPRQGFFAICSDLALSGNDDGSGEISNAEDMLSNELRPTFQSGRIDAFVVAKRDDFLSFCNIWQSVGKRRYCGTVNLRRLSCYISKLKRSSESFVKVAL